MLVKHARILCIGLTLSCAASGVAEADMCTATATLAGTYSDSKVLTVFP